jgi:hypothetical protein
MLRITRAITQRVLAVFLLVLLSGCYTISKTEYDHFSAQPVEKRMMNDIQLSWDIRADAAEYCAKISNASLAAPNTPVVACSVWTVANRRCTIITTPNTSHVVIGHEVRHCFEGHFH